jgi:hypothetical protein
LYDQILKEANVPTIFAVVKALPKGALIEKQVFLHTGRCSITDEDDISIQPREPMSEQGLVFTIGCFGSAHPGIGRPTSIYRWGSITVANITFRG